MRAALVWGGGLGASALAHGGLVVVLAAAIAPDPPPDPAAPEARFDIASYPVDQTVLTPAETGGTDVVAEQAAGARTGGAAVPQSRAASVDLADPAVPAIRADGAAVAARAPGGAAVAPIIGGDIAPPLDGAAAALSALAAPTATTPVPPASAQTPPTPLPGGAAVEIARPGTSVAEVTPPSANVATVAMPDAEMVSVAFPGTEAEEVVPSGTAAEAVAMPDAMAAAAAPSGAALLEVAPPTAVVGSGAPSGQSLPATAPPRDLADTVALPDLALASIAPDPAALRPVGRASSLQAPLPMPRAQSASVARLPPMTADTAPSGAVQNAAALPTSRQGPTALPAPVQAAAVLGTTPAQPEQPAPTEAAVVTQSIALVSPLALSDQPAATIALAAASAQATAPTGSPISTRAASGDAVFPAPPDPSRATATPPPAPRQQAALAWSGTGAAALDDLSLAAIQAFSRAGDPTDEGPRVRDGIGALLAQVPCARLQTVFDPTSGALELRGHLPEPGLRTPVLDALSAQVGAAIPLTDATMVLPRPQCGALAQIEAVGLAQSTDQLGDPRVVGDQPFAAVSVFREGERLSFAVEGPDYPAYIYVDYFDAEGQVLHLQPNAFVPLQKVAPARNLPVGLGADGTPAIDIRVAPPFGQEIMVTFASTRPLYDVTRPLVEPAGPYLEFLRDRVEQARAKDPDFRGEWFYFFVTTRPGP